MQKLEIQNGVALKQSIQNYFTDNKEARYIHRLHGLLLLIDDPCHNCDTVGALFGNSSRTISNWVKKVNAAGTVEVLRDGVHSGRKARLNEVQRVEIKAILQQHPTQSGVKANIWDGKTLSWYIAKQYNVEVGVRQCQRMFK